MDDKEIYRDSIMELILDIGEEMLFAGAEIARVEDTLTRMSMAYGAIEVDAFALTSVMLLTVTYPDGSVLTNTRRVVAGGETNFSKIDKLNSLSRRCCKQPLEIDELRAEIEKITKSPITGIYSYVGSFLAAAGFAVFFGGTWKDALVSGAFSLIICYLSSILSPRIPNKVFYYFVTSMLIGFGICLVTKYIPGFNTDMIIIGDIMVLVPGIAFTNAVKNMLIGDTLSSLIKLTECLVWTCALAGGFIIPIAAFYGG